MTKKYSKKKQSKEIKQNTRRGSSIIKKRKPSNKKKIKRGGASPVDWSEIKTNGDFKTRKFWTELTEKNCNDWIAYINSLNSNAEKIEYLKEINEVLETEVQYYHDANKTNYKTANHPLWVNLRINDAEYTKYNQYNFTIDQLKILLNFFWKITEIVYEIYKKKKTILEEIKLSFENIYYYIGVFILYYYLNEIYVKLKPDDPNYKKKLRDYQTSYLQNLDLENHFLNESIEFKNLTTGETENKKKIREYSYGINLLLYEYNYTCLLADLKYELIEYSDFIDGKEYPEEVKTNFNILVEWLDIIKESIRQKVKNLSSYKCFELFDGLRLYKLIKPSN